MSNSAEASNAKAGTVPGAQNLDRHINVVRMLFECYSTFGGFGVKASELARVLGAPDNTRLTAKQHSFRLPTHVAAKINALCDIYPSRSKTEIVGLLLAAALDEAIAHLPASLGEGYGPGPDGEMRYYEAGTIANFRRFANQHFTELEGELGNKEVADLYAGEFLVSKDQVESQ
jgi:hypothetical protein